MNSWLKPANDIKPPFAIVYRVAFELKGTTEMKFDFSADERCELFLNGRRIVDGPERGDASYWYLQHYAETLQPGKYTLCARVLCLGQDTTAHAQMSISHGFFLKSFGKLSGILDTVMGNWQCQIMEGISFHKPWPDWGPFPRFELDGTTYNWDILSGIGGEWHTVERFDDERELHEPELPRMMFKRESNFKTVYISDNVDPDAPLSSPLNEISDSIKVPAGTGRRIIIAFDDYICAWPEILFNGGIGALVKTRWAETLYDKAPSEFNIHNLKGIKSKRTEVKNKYFVAHGSSLTLPGGQRRWQEYWWRTGLYFELIIENPNEELEIELNFYRTGYPFEFAYQAESSSGELNRLLQLSLNTLQACSHETFMDCPYYEQLQYIGDVRLEALCTYVIGSDSRLPAKALKMLARSQQPDGMIFSRYPARVDQVIPSFSLIYILSIHDFALWRDDSETVKYLLPTARRIMEYLLNHFDSEKLLQLPGWVFLDWVWFHGVPPGNCALNWLFVQALEKLADLEKHFGEKELSEKYKQTAAEVSIAIIKKYFDQDRGIFADDEEHKEFSEHPQVLALLTRQLSPQLQESLIAGLNKGLHQCSIYFSYYYLETCYKYRLDDLFFKRLEKWYALEKEGLKTLPEEFEGPRSDCHAWSSHILYHYYASILGIRPTAFGFKNIQFKPMTGPLEYAKGTTNNIEVEVQKGVKRIIHANEPLID